MRDNTGSANPLCAYRHECHCRLNTTSNTAPSLSGIMDRVVCLFPSMNTRWLRSFCCSHCACKPGLAHQRSTSSEECPPKTTSHWCRSNGSGPRRVQTITRTPRKTTCENGMDLCMLPHGKCGLQLRVQIPRRPARSLRRETREGQAKGQDVPSQAYVALRRLWRFVAMVLFLVWSGTSGAGSIFSSGATPQACGGRSIQGRAPAAQEWGRTVGAETLDGDGQCRAVSLRIARVQTVAAPLSPIQWAAGCHNCLNAEARDVFDAFYKELEHGLRGAGPTAETPVIPPTPAPETPQGQAGAFAPFPKPRSHRDSPAVVPASMSALVHKDDWCG